MRFKDVPQPARVVAAEILDDLPGLVARVVVDHKHFRRARLAQRGHSYTLERPSQALAAVIRAQNHCDLHHLAPPFLLLSGIPWSASYGTPLPEARGHHLQG